MPFPSDPGALKTLVRDKYAAVLTDAAAGCGCGAASDIDMIGDAYEGVAGHLPEADFGLGCGLPTEYAALQPGETVLDLGAGAGIDLFVAREAVGAEGRLIGVDMTPAMVEKGRANADALGASNVEFRLGEIEALPVETASVDVVISNCVLNLVPDKPRAFAEMARVLRPGGRFCVSDVVTRGALTDAVRHSAELYVGCVSGALAASDYLAGLRAAGFEDVRVATEKRIPLPEALAPEGAVVSITVLGTRAA